MTATIAVRLAALQKMLVQSIRIRVVIRNVSKGRAAIPACHGPVRLTHDRGLVPPRLGGRAAIAIAVVGRCLGGGAWVGERVGRHRPIVWGGYSNNVFF
jgi:hypothetical protein